MIGSICAKCMTTFWGTEYSLGNKGPYCWDCRKTMTNKIKSDGGSTSYYDLPKHATELRHLISHKGMSFARGNIMKAVYRLGEKDGADVEYDINKVIFFANELLEMHKRGEHI